MSKRRQPQTLVGWVAAVVAAQPRRPALIQDGAVWSYREMWARAEQVARHVLDQPGFSPGSYVGLLGHNESAYLTAYLGVIRAGGVVVPLNAMLTPDELRGQLEFVEPVGLIAGGGVDADLRAELSEACPVWPMEELSGGGAGELPANEPSSPASILLTSGSTGQPKGVIHTQGTLLHAALQLGSALPYTSADRSVAFLPFYASIPEQVLPTLVTGGSLDIVPRFDVERVSRACAAATGFDAVPTVMARLLDHGDPDELRHLKWVVFASEPMPPALLERWWDALPTVETHEFYGMTEVLPITYASHRMLRAQPTSVGLPFPTSSVSVVDEAGAELPPAASGEVICGSAARMHGYLGDEQATAGSTTPAGAMRTGDLGWFDEAGLLFLSGRLKDVIISGGLNIVPAEIEAVACRHPQVAVAAVVGIPDARWGETPVVVAVPTPGATITAGDVLEHCRHGLASFKRPSGAALVEVLPVTGIGKSAKTVIRQQVLDGTIALVRSDRARPLSA